MLTVGTNSYVTIAEADDYLGGEVGGERWSKLEEAQKERFLITAARKIDALQLRGAKADSSQTMSFPRLPDFGTDIVKQAQILEAFALTDSAALQRAALQEQGVSSVNVGNASESYIECAQRKLLSVQANQLLRSYMTGSVRLI